MMDKVDLSKSITNVLNDLKNICESPQRQETTRDRKYRIVSYLFLGVTVFIAIITALLVSHGINNHTNPSTVFSILNIGTSASLFTGIIAVLIPTFVLFNKLKSISKITHEELEANATEYELVYSLLEKYDESMLQNAKDFIDSKNRVIDLAISFVFGKRDNFSLLLFPASMYAVYVAFIGDDAKKSGVTEVVVSSSVSTHPFLIFITSAMLIIFISGIYNYKFFRRNYFYSEIINISIQRKNRK